MFNTPYALSDRTTRTITPVDMVSDELAWGAIWLHKATGETITPVDTIEFSGLSTSGNKFTIVTKLEDAQRWVNGEFIQNCFPYLNADEREILMTGIDAQAWETMLVGMQEEEEEEEV